MNLPHSPTIIVIGAGMMQMPLIKDIKRRGFRAVIVDQNPGAPGMALADRAIAADISNIAATVKSLKDTGEKYDAVLTVGTDFSTTVSSIVEKFRLPGLPFETALHCRDKIKMRKRLAQMKVPQPEFTGITTHDDYEKILRTITYPIVMKPADSMGARGVKYCNTANEALGWYETAENYSKNKRVIAEEYIPGQELSIDALIYNNEITITGIADRIIDLPPFFVEYGHILPSNANPEKIEQALSVFRQGIMALGITNGAAKGDIKINKQGAFVGEIAARLSGGFMSGYTYPYATGVNLMEAVVNISLGLPPGDLTPRFNHVSFEKAIPAAPGVVKEITGIDELRDIPEVKEIFLHCDTGDTIVTPKNNVEKAGNIIVSAPDRNKAISVMQKALSTVKIITAPA